jgi:hypothetical protein
MENPDEQDNEVAEGMLTPFAQFRVAHNHRHSRTNTLSARALLLDLVNTIQIEDDRSTSIYLLKRDIKTQRCSSNLYVVLGAPHEFDFAGLSACLSRLSSKQAKKLSRTFDKDPRDMFEDVLLPADIPRSHSGSDMSSCSGTVRSFVSQESELVNGLLAAARDAEGTETVATSTDDEADFSTVNSVGAVAPPTEGEEEDGLSVQTLYRVLSNNLPNA